MTECNKKSNLLEENEKLLKSQLELIEQEYEIEFGCKEQIHFASPKMEINGEEIKCKCGKPATNSIIGKKAYMNLCNKCAGYE